MTPSPAIATFMKGYETLRLKAYMPTPNDVPTIGYGETAGVKMGMTWTRDQAEANFAARLAQLGDWLTTVLRSAPTTQGQFDAMTSLADNIGQMAFLHSSVLTNHRAGHYATAALAFGLWNKQRDGSGNLVELRGLTKRRAAEAAIYRGQT